MQVVRLTKRGQFRKFVSMADKIYRGDDFYVPYMRRDLRKTVRRLVRSGTYTALAVEDKGEYLARVLFTVGPSKQLHRKKCGYFSHFECVNDKKVAALLLGEMCRLLKEAGADHTEGTYFPYDQDNRRGILVQGFERPPMILTSYNPPYYGELLEACGFRKDFDTVAYHLDYDRYDTERIEPLTRRILDRFGLEIRPADFKNLDHEIEDVQQVIAEATNEQIFQEAPSREDLVRIVKNWRSFLWPDFIHICRRKADGRPVGVMMSIPDYFTVFRRMNGRINPVSLLRAAYWRKRIRSVRAMLQFVVPDYQMRGVNFALYHEFYKTCRRRGITEMEAGTIMENNVASRLNVEKASGVLDKIYRIFGREL